MTNIEQTETSETLAFVERAIDQIESRSIREWALSNRNLPHVVEAARTMLAERPNAKPSDLALLLLVTAMG